MPDFSKMNKNELLLYAANNEITLYTSDNTKAEIIARIEAAEQFVPFVETETTQGATLVEESIETDESTPQEENETPEDDQGVKTTEEETSTPSVVKSRITISNPTLSARGIMLNKGVMFLEPGEVKLVPEEDEDEIRALFKTESLQAVVDSGLLRFSGLGDDPLVEQPTVEAPESLTSAVQVGDTGLSVGGNATRQYDPYSEQRIQNAGYMPIA